MEFNRRNLLLGACAVVGTAMTRPPSLDVARAPGPIFRPGIPARPGVAQSVAAVPAKPWVPDGVEPALFAAALASLDRQRRNVKRDRIGIVDFSAPSSQPRFHLVDLEDSAVTTLHVAHGSGSDPAHSGWLQRFSNVPDSNATSEGSYLTANYYVGQHGRSQKLIGLDRTNDNALMRAIVIHGAWYAEKEMIPAHGKLGRSQGCLAVGDSQLSRVFDHLGTDRLIYAAKLA